MSDDEYENPYKIGNNNIGTVDDRDDDEEEEEEDIDPALNEDEEEEDEEEEEEDDLNPVLDDEEEEDDMIGGADDDEDDNYVSDDEDEDEDDENENNVAKKKQKKISKTTLLDSDDENDEDDDDPEENFLQKFDTEINKNYIYDFHPECIIHNYDEILSLTKVVKDSDNIIIDPLHKTVPFLTKYERARILGQRAKQIEYGAKPFVSVPENIIDANIIAELELKQKKIPFVIRRPLPSGAFEYWNIKDLEVISF